jgi:hypothetical protein
VQSQLIYDLGCEVGEGLIVAVKQDIPAPLPSGTLSEIQVTQCVRARAPELQVSKAQGRQFRIDSVNNAITLPLPCGLAERRRQAEDLLSLLLEEIQLEGFVDSEALRERNDAFDVRKI